jgi:pSer/pThr/pTyr-binding forkhead associated (FHA) protein
MSRSIELMIMSGPDDGARLRLAAPRSGAAYVFGRREDCDVVLPYDSHISRHHARLYADSGGNWYLEDLSSRNGTYIGKQRVTGIASITVGQMFRMGRTWLRFCGDSGESTNS